MTQLVSYHCRRKNFWDVKKVQSFKYEWNQVAEHYKNQLLLIILAVCYGRQYEMSLEDLWVSCHLRDHYQRFSYTFYHSSIKDINQSNVLFKNRAGIYIKCGIGQSFRHLQFSQITLKSRTVMKLVCNSMGILLNLFLIMDKFFTYICYICNTCYIFR